MDPRDSEHVRVFEETLEAWTDSRFVTRDQVRTMAMFIMYLVNLAEQDGWRLRGWSWKEESSMGCLVVKSTIDDTPYVAFTSARTATNGMRVFLRKMGEDRVVWVPDKYG